MAAVSWLSDISGNWSTAADWSDGIVPGAMDDATIATGGTYTVTVSAAQAVNSLTLDAAGATFLVENAATLTLGSSLTLTAGAFNFKGGTIEGGVIEDDSGLLSVDSEGDVFNGVTYDGVLNVVGTRVELTVAGAGMINKGADGAGDGVINVSGEAVQLRFKGVQTLDDATVNLGAPGGVPAVLDVGGVPSSALTVGPNAVVNALGNVTIEGQTVVNHGLVEVDGKLTFDSSHFTNDAAVAIAAGGAISIVTGRFVNAAGATLSIGDGATVDLGEDPQSTTITNAGTIVFGDRDLVKMAAGYVAFTNQAGATLTVGSGDDIDLAPSRA